MTQATEKLMDIPAGEVDEIEENFKLDGATVERITQGNGLFTLIATFGSHIPASPTVSSSALSQQPPKDVTSHLPETEKLTDIPADEVDEVEESFKLDGATVERITQSDGLFTLIATFGSRTPVSPTVSSSALSLQQLKDTMPHSTEANRTKFIVPLNDVMKKYEVNSPLRQAHFLAQLAHESGSLRYTEEIASGAAYEGRVDLGNTQPGDGKRFKGRGLIQLTGRSNYEKYGIHIHIDLLTAPQLVSEDPHLAVDAAGWFWMIRKLNKLADDDNIRAVTKKINGGFNGLSERQRHLKRGKSALNI